MTLPDDSDSSEQRALEAPLLRRAALKLGLEDAVVQGRRVAMSTTAYVQVDGWIASDPPAYFEVYASLGEPRGGQCHKLKGDVLKFALLRHRVPSARCVMVVTSEGAESWLGRGWVRQAVEQFRVEVCRVPLTEEEEAQLATARIRQRQGMSQPRGPTTAKATAKRRG